MKTLNYTLTLVIFAISFTMQSQNKEILEAFSKSYKHSEAAKYDLAIADFSKVYNVNSYEMNLRLGWLNYLAGKNKESIVYYTRACKLMPAATEPKWAIITVYTKMEKWNEIKSEYYAILKLDPKNAEANYHLALIFYFRKEYAGAKKYFDISLNLAPFNYNYMLMSAWTNYFLGNTNKAIILFNKVLLYMPNDSSALEGLSLIK